LYHALAIEELSKWALQYPRKIGQNLTCYRSGAHRAARWFPETEPPLFLTTAQLRKAFAAIGSAMT